ncbi:hypothetical protein AG1IA_03375 [Rhizoctonia solani AG-1 IA]|uniref:Uncharacterized protein n=1 Tax=Thanatephorus cucumeris (strain AG1-IA) TaxID=983506 RepID=L8WX77_THACA|nr:hypothetical protein AG1IA_03375 [Rhizoctonia solani AG-1 IA]
MEVVRRRCGPLVSRCLSSDPRETGIHRDKYTIQCLTRFADALPVTQILPMLLNPVLGRRRCIAGSVDRPGPDRQPRTETRGGTAVPLLSYHHPNLPAWPAVLKPATINTKGQHCARRSFIHTISFHNEQTPVNCISKQIRTNRLSIPCEHPQHSSITKPTGVVIANVLIILYS